MAVVKRENGNGKKCDVAANNGIPHVTSAVRRPVVSKAGASHVFLGCSSTGQMLQSGSSITSARKRSSRNFPGTSGVMNRISRCLTVRGTRSSRRDKRVVKF